MGSPKKLLVIGKVWPEPKSSAAGTRIVQIMSIFKEHGYEVFFSSASKKSEYSTDLSKVGIIEHPIELNDSSFNHFVKDLNPDVVLFDRYMTEEQFGWRVQESIPESIRILDTEDLHFLRRARELCFKNGGKPITEYQPYLKNEIMVREFASILRCDFSIMISYFEIDVLFRELKVPKSKILYLPLLLDDQKLNLLDNSPDFSSRHHFVTIGNFLHPPNWDSIVYLKEKIWPGIYEKLPNAEIHIFGAYPSQKVFNLHSEKDGFLIKGRADLVHKTLSNYRVMLAPLRFGAGQKGKLLDAMSVGLPSVTTGIGAEGMRGNNLWPGYIFDEPEEIISHSLTLYNDASAWKDKRNNIRPILEDQFLSTKFVSKFWFSLTEKYENIAEIRSKDYVGEMLNYQNNNASKYMGKWIEEKNR